ncbi:MAG: hypothetical protein QOF18_1318, partial [Frankiaceae bacterium]|nr:hypothetical protein [Frankiaceae bacterium]
MLLMVECPDELLDEVAVPAVMTGAGVALEAVEEVPAGPWLAVLLDDVDIEKLSEWDLPAYLRACARVQAWAAARLSDGVAELSSRPGGFGADKEVALALREPVGAAQRRIYHARRLRRLLPKARCLFGRGDLDQRHVDALIDATGSVEDPDLIAAVEDRVLSAPRALAKTAVELRRDARDAVNRLDPDGAQARARAAREEADVSLLPGADGMATVMIDAPVEQAVTVKTAADAYAATRKTAGDTRRIGVLRAEGLARICADSLTGTSTLGGVPRSGGRPIEIGIVVGLDTALGQQDLPAEVPGHGLVPRDVIARMIRTEQPRLRLMIIDETTGRLLHRAVDAYRPTADQVAHIR